MTQSPSGPNGKAVEEIFYPVEKIPFVEWQEFSGAKPTVALTGVIMFLSFLTGLSNLSQATITLEGPLATVLPMAGGFVRFGGVLFAFALGPVTIGLQRRQRFAWRAAIVLLPCLAVLPLTTLQTTEIPLLLAVLVTYPLLIRNRDRFDQSLDLSPLQIASLLSVGGVVIYGTVGSYAIRTQFSSIESWADAVYYVIITSTTVGYGDITPTTPEAKWFSLSIVLLGAGAFTVAVGALVVPAIESRMAAAFGNMTASDLTLLEDHIVVLGYGDVTESLLDEVASETDHVVVTRDADIASALTADGVTVLTDDPTDETVLADARVDTARGVVVGSDDDARNVLGVLATKNVNSDVRVVAAATEEKHVQKLDAVGADEVINLRSIGGRLLGRSVLESESSSVVEDLSDGNTE